MDPFTDIVSIMVIFVWCFYLLFFLMFFLAAAVMMLFSIFSTIFWILMLVDCVQRKEKDFPEGQTQLTWVLVIALTGIIGALIYYLIVKRAKPTVNAPKGNTPSTASRPTKVKQ
jgi:hypothetical protein